jgi:hypothetical protein
MMTFRTLPELQAHLDHLRTGEQVDIPRADYQRLFGDNDAGRARLEHFAKGHRCVAYWSPSAIVLRRAPEKVMDARTHQVHDGGIEGL